MNIQQFIEEISEIQAQDDAEWHDIAMQWKELSRRWMRIAISQTIVSAILLAELVYLIWSGRL